MDHILRGVPSPSFIWMTYWWPARPQPITPIICEVFQLLSANGLVVNRAKSVFRVSELTYLGHLVNTKGITPLPSRVDATCDFPTPESKASLQCFLGMINCFLPQLADKLRPLHEATKVKGQAITWTPECTTAFNEAKLSLTSAALLHHPDPKLHEATKVKGQAITWTPQCTTTFNEAKLALTSAALLHHPDPILL